MRARVSLLVLVPCVCGVLAGLFAGADFRLAPLPGELQVHRSELTFQNHDRRPMEIAPGKWLPIGHLFEDPAEIVKRLFSYMPNTQAFNNSGQPAMSVPLAWSSGGLPIGLQFVARMGEEAPLFRLAAQLEQAKPWFDRVAPL